VTIFLLIRHASHDLLGRALAGRSSAVGLSGQGHAEARRLAERLTGAGIDALYVSPQRRARETAAPLAATLGLDPVVREELDEIHFGGWTGYSFDRLAGDPAWAVWVGQRSAACPPGGESIVSAQQRIVKWIDALGARYGDRTIALVSHGDVIKAAVAHVLSSPLDQLERFEIAPASVSVIAAGPGWAQVRLLNHTGPLDAR
jgi:broad specificity phosphatase PhoE